MGSARTGAVIAAVAWLVWACPATSRAATVVSLSRDGHALVRNDRFLPAADLLPRPVGAARVPLTASAGRASSRTVRGVLAQLVRTHQISRPTYLTYSGAFNSSLKEAKHLPAARRRELQAVITNLHAMAVRGALTTARLPALFLTLQRNGQYWRHGPMLGYGGRVEFAGSELVWEYYPGQGLELQQLGSFGKASGLCTAGPQDAARCRAILAELLPLAVRRGGGLTWEYYFTFDGGAPPWTSAMSQATAVQAFAAAAHELDDVGYLTIAHEALPVLYAPPPAGVGVRTPLGIRFVQYSFDPAAKDEVINAFLQTLIGVGTFAQASGDPAAQQLFTQGDAEARSELPRFNTGAWSLYQPGVEDDLSYHQLVTGFLRRLCSMTSATIYCDTADAFTRDLSTPPVLGLVTRRLRVRHAAQVHFTLSKVSRVGITVLRNGRTVFLTSAPFRYGRHAFTVPPLTRRGLYTVRLGATDLAGNFSHIAATVTVTK
jgi:hypothetical protein